MATPKEKVEAVLAGGHSDRVPFTMYESKIPHCTAERLMRNRGMCILNRQAVYKVHTPNVTETIHTYYEDGRTFQRFHYDTPVGNLSMLFESAGFTSWGHERMFKTPEDYKVLRFMIADQQFEESYASVVQAQKNFGDDIICRGGMGAEPLQCLISGHYMGMETFCTEWMDRRDEILALYEILVEKQREIYPLVANSPVGHANYGGNVVPEIIGPDTFEKYYVQHYNEAAEVMHKQGKLIGCYFDANCRLLSEAIGSTDLDYIEAFTPAPDTDMTLGEARQAWPDKVLWLNFPSSVQLASDEKVEATTVELLEQLDSIDGIIIGITEDIPEDRWRGSCTAIMDGLDRHAQTHEELYR